MPIYEYKCRGCGEQFEKIVRTGDIPACPSCQSPDLEQQLSAFAVNSEETSKAAFRVARRENEKVLRDQRIAQAEEEHHHHH